MNAQSCSLFFFGSRSVRLRCRSSSNPTVNKLQTSCVRWSVVTSFRSAEHPLLSTQHSYIPSTFHLCLFRGPSATVLIFRPVQRSKSWIHLHAGGDGHMSYVIYGHICHISVDGVVGHRHHSSQTNKYGRYYGPGRMVAPAWWRHLVNGSKNTPN